MTTLRKLDRTGWSSLPTIFAPTLIDRFLDEFENNEDWYTIKDTYPYNITQERDPEGEILSTDITFALAGVSKENVNVKLEDGALIVLVDKQERVNESNVTYLHRGISSRGMRTKFNLYNVDVDNITSTFKDGLLEIKLPNRVKTIKQININ